ncbi:MAG: hypothetical protein CL840_21455 [Crocinitomicaceae bacterium]|nr:hypothetical protein [Crocinitomicaceae bacterium]|tara:strand:+ start:15446 stop:15910 length:465 start_codon:yes stop_codon:yes gene_type:complete
MRLNITLILIILSGNVVWGQNIYLLKGNDTITNKEVNIQITLIESNSRTALTIGKNDFTRINPKSCIGTEIVYKGDTIIFNQVIESAPNTSPVLIDAMKSMDSDYEKILQRDWAVIIDRIPVSNRILLKEDHSDVKDGVEIIAMITDRLSWVYL